MSSNQKSNKDSLPLLLENLKKAYKKNIQGPIKSFEREYQATTKKEFIKDIAKFLSNRGVKKLAGINAWKNNEELRIALEYNGQQHYTYTPYFHKSKKNFYSQVHRDDWKRSRCRELGIRLIEVPYWVTPIDLEDYIVRELKKKGCL